MDFGRYKCPMLIGGHCRIQDTSGYGVDECPHYNEWRNGYWLNCAKWKGYSAFRQLGTRPRRPVL